MKAAVLNTQTCPFAKVTTQSPSLAAASPPPALTASLPVEPLTPEATLTGMVADVAAVADAEDLQIDYADPWMLLQDLQAAGETNAVAQRDRRIPPRALFATALASLAEGGARMPVRLRLAFMTGWAPADSQPKPLAPGSGRISLADVLGPDAT